MAEREGGSVNILQTLNVHELVKHSSLDHAGQMFVVDLIRDNSRNASDPVSPATKVAE